MNSSYHQIIDMLNDLNPTELASLVGEISRRLQSVYEETDVTIQPDEEDDSQRTYLPRMPHLVEWGLVRPGDDKVYIHTNPDEPALLLDSYHVAYQGERMEINTWARHITGWKSANIYENIVVQRTGQTLDEMRRAYIDLHGWES